MLCWQTPGKNETIPFSFAWVHMASKFTTYVTTNGFKSMILRNIVKKVIIALKMHLMIILMMKSIIIDMKAFWDVMGTDKPLELIKSLVI